MVAVFFHTTSSKDRKSLLEVVKKTTARYINTSIFICLLDKVFALYRMKIC